MQKDTIVLHHTANPNPKHQAQIVIAQHLKEPKIKQAGAYHYVIEKDGTVARLHPEEFIGNHAGNWAVNLRSIGVCLAGNFVTQSPTPDQIISLGKLLTEMQNRWGIPDKNIKLHKEVRLNPTACPGIDLRAIYLAERRKRSELRYKDYTTEYEKASGPRKKLLLRILWRFAKALS